MASERLVAVAGHAGPPFRVEQHFDKTQHLGSLVWAAGLALAAHVSQHAGQMQREARERWGGGGPDRPVRVLELGCGTAAIVAQCAALHGMHAVATDLPEVLGWARRNIELNRPHQWGHGPVAAAAAADRLRLQTLRWGDAAAAAQVMCEHCGGDAGGGDAGGGGGFDYVLAADCIYATRDDPQLTAMLFDTLRALLRGRRTVLLLAYQSRFGRASEREFVEQTLPRFGFRSERLPLPPGAPGAHLAKVQWAGGGGGCGGDAAAAAAAAATAAV